MEFFFTAVVDALQAFMDRVAALGACFLAVSAIVLVLIVRWFRARRLRKVERQQPAKRMERLGPPGM